MSERELELTPSQTLAFFASVIKSGEPWTATCQKAYDEAQTALTASRQSILEEAERVREEVQKIVDEQWGAHRETVSPLNAFEHFCILNKKWVDLHDRLRAALSPDGKAPAKEGDEG